MKAERGVGGLLVLLLGAGLAAALTIAAPASAAIVQRTAWGSEGPGAGQFRSPEGVATDSAGHVYVADRGAYRIQKFSPGGGFRLAWGWGVRNGQSELQTCRSSCQSGLDGSGAGQLNAPNGVAPDSEGHVYVADTGNDRIQKFSPRGRVLDQWGSSGSDPGEFDAPVDVDVGPAGQVYVADFFNGRIQRFSPGGRFLGQWAAFDPYGLGTDSAGRVYVAEYYEGRVEKFSPAGRFLRMWGWGVRDGSNEFQRCGPPRAACSLGLGGSGDGQFSGPQGIATDSADHVYVADSSNDRIQKLTAGGRFLTTWGEFGDGRGQFILASDVATNSAGRVYVADLVNDRIVKYAQIPPRTKIMASRVGDARGRAKFRFKSSERGSSFKCKLDRRRFRGCDSPKTYRDLGASEHVFKVRAIGPDELRDPTPAKKRFWIS